MVAFFQVDPSFMRQVGVGSLMDIEVVGWVGQDIPELPEDRLEGLGQ